MGGSSPAPSVIVSSPPEVDAAAAAADSAMVLCDAVLRRLLVT